MWHLKNTIGSPSPLMGPCTGQKREFSFYHVPSAPIVPGKSFTNPNFVNKHHPSVHSYQNNFILTPSEKLSCIDSSISNRPTHAYKAQENSSQSIVDAIKQNHLDVVLNEGDSQVEVAKVQEMCYGRKRNKRNRHRRRRSPTKQNNYCCRQLSDMMEIDLDLETPLAASDISICPRTKNTCTLTDFIVEKAHKHKKDDRSICGSDEEDVTALVISCTPPSSNKTCLRERQLSITESEDSFIVFDSGTDEELAFSEESEDESDSEEDEVDSSSSVVPHKRVRFAEDDDLCEVHPMVQWSYAYQQARKGPWEEYARDRDRFRKRISCTEKILLPIFDPKHRESVYHERFMNDISCM